MKQHGKGPHVDARRRPHVYADADKRVATQAQPVVADDAGHESLEGEGNGTKQVELPPLVVKGRNIDVTRHLHSYIEKRFAKLAKQLPDDTTRFEVEISVERNPRVADCHNVEATIWTKGPTLRAHESSHDMYAGIDLISEKLYRQVRRYREKRIQYKQGTKNGNGRYKSAPRANSPAELAKQFALKTDSQYLEEHMAYAETPLDIVRSKQFRGGLMTPEEAAEQMALFGHEFFVFVNAEDGETAVLYKRSDGNLGLIEAEATEEEKAS